MGSGLPHGRGGRHDLACGKPGPQHELACFVISQVTASKLFTTLDQLHRQLFGEERELRYTLFQPDPADPSYILPAYRYYPGVDDPIARAKASHVRYVREDGITGTAWSYPGHVCFKLLPPFQSMDRLRNYYTETLRVHEDHVESISDYMLEVRAILAIGLESFVGEDLGVISIDFKEPVEVHLPTTRRMILERLRAWLHPHVIVDKSLLPRVTVGGAECKFVDLLLGVGHVRHILNESTERKEDV